jgi:hypothetical protein
VSAAYRNRPELRLYIPVAFYVDALAEHFVQGRYLKLHVALESFAYWVSKVMPPDVPLVADDEKWSAWVAGQRDALRELAGQDQQDALYSMVAGISKSPRTSRLVKRVFATFRSDRSISMTCEMKDELVDRNLIVHTAEMLRDGIKPAGVDLYLDKIAFVRSLLVGLVGLVADYQGAIVGWQRERGRDYNAAPASWWPVSDEASEAARVRFVASPAPSP